MSALQMCPACGRDVRPCAGVSLFSDATTATLVAQQPAMAGRSAASAAVLLALFESGVSYSAPQLAQLRGRIAGASLYAQLDALTAAGQLRREDGPRGRRWVRA